MVATKPAEGDGATGAAAGWNGSISMVDGPSLFVHCGAPLKPSPSGSTSMTLPLSGRLIRTFTGWFNGLHQLLHWTPMDVASSAPGGMRAGPGSSLLLGRCATDSRLPLRSLSRTSGAPCSEQGEPLVLVKRTPPTSRSPAGFHEPLAAIWNAVHGRVPGGAVTRGVSAGSAAGAVNHPTAPGLGWKSVGPAPAVGGGVVGSSVGSVSSSPALTDAVS